MQELVSVKAQSRSGTSRIGAARSAGQSMMVYGGFKKTDSVMYCRVEVRKNWTFSGATILFR